MINLFLASSFSDVVDLFIDFTRGECRGKRVTFIAAASIPEEVDFYVAEAKAAFSGAGVQVEELDITTASRELIAEKIATNDYIYISGGNTFFLLQELKRSGADRLIIEQVRAGKLYAGESAGAIVLAPDIEYIKGMDSSEAAPDLQRFSSLSLVDFYPLPHYRNFPFEEAADQILSAYQNTIDIRPFSNSQAILVADDEISVVNS